jgi:hypothetical protein
MPKRTSGLIPEIYRKNFETIGMFFWVEGQKHIVPTITTKEAIEKYFNFINIDWDMEVAVTTYLRIKKEYLKNG